jgi:DNA-binding NarL/FixJ family response regulator
VNRFLVVSNVPDEATTVKDTLTGGGDAPCNVEWLRRLEPAIERLHLGDVDAIIADFTLPDSHGMTTFDQLYAAAPQIPILMLCPTKKQELGLEALQRGAGGYLLKEAFGTDRVSQAIHYVFHWPPTRYMNSSEATPTTPDRTAPPSGTGPVAGLPGSILGKVRTGRPPDTAVVPTAKVASGRK